MGSLKESCQSRSGQDSGCGGENANDDPNRETEREAPGTQGRDGSRGVSSERMKFILTVVPMSRATRRRVGKSYTDIVEAHEGSLPLSVEGEYEAEHNQSPSSTVVKVIDVRPASDQGTR